MSSARATYRKLSSWQSFFVGAALFADEHCLISVRSSGFEEHVKRLYFKDIQAIVVSKSRRFGVSRWVILCAFLLWVGIGFGSAYSQFLASFHWELAAGLVIGWLLIAIKESCRCRIYTAVSQEELLSVRRPWTARKLLAELTPLIEAAQGTLPAGWQESLAVDRPIVLAQAAPKTEIQGNNPAERAESRSGRITASAVLVTSLFLDVVLTSWDLQRTQPMPNWIGSLLALIEAAAAVWVLIQNRGINILLQRLGAVVLIFLGLAFYGQFGIGGFAQAQAQIRAKRPLPAVNIRANPMHRGYLEIYIAGCLVLGVLGVFLTLAAPVPQRQRVPGD
jgi:hypothetical protein